MDIHKPKPWHGWREFLREYATIVIGVLTALAFEQAVEWLHWQGKVRSAEHAIQTDLALTADLASERVALSRCLDDRLNVLKALVEGPQPSAGPLPAAAGGYPMSAPYRAPARAWNTQAWDGIMADGTYAHLTPDRARALSLLYYTVGNMREANFAEKNEAPDLDVLEDKAIALTPDKRVELLQHIAKLRWFNQDLTKVSKQILRRIDDAGYLPPLKDTERRLAGEYSQAMLCRHAEEDLKDRVLKGWFTLHR
jgi:hypothetical protein